ncbi:UPF0481 protein At3g47200-like [Phoenix dactylifera]|uniref:UPF0481 protein At3g47200-like n=1 Tax=Phoenix dactylifera TaxID=42345 RepID=A0A8B9AY61_PHODC|nr:UPF0481 protein At3g47200-like [Phoenix dactylifera]
MDHPEELCTIFEVPKHIRQLDEKAYEPKIVCLGPFRRKILGSYITKYHKWRCVRHLLSRDSRHQSQKDASELFDSCLSMLKYLDEEVRSCYSQEFSKLNAQDMALIMLLDGCFIIYLMLKMCPRKKPLEPGRGQRMRRLLQRREIKIEIWERGLNIEKDKKGKGIAKEREVRKLGGEATKEDEGKKRREFMIRMREGEFVLDIKEKDEKGKGILKETEVGKSEGEATEEDEGKKRREFTIGMREGEFVIDIKEKDKKGKGIVKEKEVGKLEREATEEEVLNIGEKDEQLEGPTVAGQFTINLVVYDLLKLENQIPFFIIHFLFRHLKTSEDRLDLVDLALGLFKDIHPEESKSFKKKSPEEYHHLLHLFYSSRIPPEKPAEPTREREATPAQEEAAPSQGDPRSAPTSTSAQGSPTSTPKWIPSATELDRAGVKFKRKDSAECFLNMEFQTRNMKLMPLQCLWNLCLKLRSGRMEIPQLQIYDYTGPLFQNLIAFEQCYFDTEMYFTIYALFMDCIIDQAEDVRLLQLKDILKHKLSSPQDVADLFNQLGSHLHYVQKKNHLTNQIEEINKFCDFKWHKWLAALRRDYLGNPWTTISVLAAVFLLLLTVEQAVFSALSYVHPS